MELEGFATLLQRTPLELAGLVDPLAGGDPETVRWLLVATAMWWLWLSMSALVRALGWRVVQRLQGRSGVQLERTWWLSGLPWLSLASVLAPLGGWWQLYRSGELVLAWWSLAAVAQVLAVGLRALRVEALWLERQHRALVRQRRDGPWRLVVERWPLPATAVPSGAVGATSPPLPAWLVAQCGTAERARAYLAWAQQTADAQR
jgi:hypothetical protein